jgi:hypothetical protein
MIDAWRLGAIQQLLSMRHPDGGWGYQAGAVMATEPTSLALLALVGSATPADLSATIERLLERQRLDGFFTAGPSHLEPSWCTPLAMLALQKAGHTSEAQSAANSLLTTPVFTFDATLASGIYGYDTSLAGWPWTNGDFSFVEPTAMAIIALKQLDFSAEVRVQEAAAMLRARVLSAGGWNYGEPKVLGGELFPAIIPTALALLALANEQDEITATALNWLLSQQGQISSLFSLGWAAIALNVLSAMNDHWKADVITKWTESPAERRGPMETALALLALANREEHPLAFS